MLSIITAILGFGSNFLPEVFKFFNRAQDNGHELKMLELQLKAAGEQHSWKLEEINATADISEAIELHKPQQSFGVQLLDSAQKFANTTWGKVLIIPAFYVYVFLDFLSGSVRPLITFAISGLYGAIKYSQYQIAGETMKSTEALLSIWGDQDFAVLTLCLSFWFGSRVYKAAFGGSTQDNKRN